MTCCANCEGPGPLTRRMYTTAGTGYRVAGVLEHKVCKPKFIADCIHRRNQLDLQRYGRIEGHGPTTYSDT